MAGKSNEESVTCEGSKRRPRDEQVSFETLLWN